MPVVVEPIERVIPAAGGGGRPPGSDSDGGFRGDRGRGGPRKNGRAYHTGIWVALAPMLMLFAGFASSYIVRRGASTDWRPIDLPLILWLNTAFLVCSSLTLERSRSRLGRWQLAAFSRWWSVTTALGVAFLAGQLVAWWQLAARGVYLASNPSSSFFYLLTAAHGLHLLGGLIALGYVGFRAARVAVGPANRTVVDVTAVYWHFLGVLWVSLFLLLLVWR